MRHLKEAFKYACFIEEGAQQALVSVPIVFGIGSRESGWGTLLKPKGPAGTGDATPRKWPTKYRKAGLPPDGGGFGRGLMQIDFDAHPFARTTDDWKDPHKNILYGCRVLRENLAFLKKQHTVNLTEDRLLAAAISSYNCGAANVVRSLAVGDPVDRRTAHHNYSTDVLAKAAWFDSVGGWTALKGN